MSTTNKGTGALTTGKPTAGSSRAVAPLSPKAPRICVTESNRSVESQIEAAGGLPIRPGYSAEQAVRDLQDCDGLLITGGGDVNPALYGQERDKSVYGLTSGRDLRELALLGAARDLGLPVLGICRGLQIINVEGGGTLYQNIPDKVGHDWHSCTMARVHTTRGSLVNRTLGDDPTMLHLHHQSVRRLAKGFLVTARAADGIVEAIESFDGRVIGVQFHPESVLTSVAVEHTGWQLFDAYVAACTRYRRRVRTTGRPTISDPSKYVQSWPVAVKAHQTVGGTSWQGSGKGYVTTSKGRRETVTTDPKVLGTPLLTLVGNDGTATDDHGNGIAGWCGPCGIAFDNDRDWVDHMEWFHDYGRV